MRQRWAVVLAAKEPRCEFHATDRDERSAPSRFRRLVDELLLIEETAPEGAEPLDHIRTLLLLAPARQILDHVKAPSADAQADQAAAVGMAFALGRIRRVDRDGVVGFFPSISHFADVEKFHEAVSRAYQVAARNRTRLILAGTAPVDPGVDIGPTDPCLPAPTVPGHQAFVVNEFARYPRAVMADPMSIRSGSWNVSLTVGTVDAFRASFLAAQPLLTVMVDAIASVRSAEEEPQAVETALARLSRLLSPRGVALAPQRCLVVPLVAASPVLRQGRSPSSPSG